MSNHGRLRDGASQVAVSDIALTLVEGGDKRMLHEAVVRPRRQLQSGTCFLTDPTPDAFLLVALIGPLSGGQTADVVRFVSSPPNTVPHPATLPYQPHATPCHPPPTLVYAQVGELTAFADDPEAATVSARHAHSPHASRSSPRGAGMRTSARHVLRMALGLLEAVCFGALIARC